MSHSHQTDPIDSALDYQDHLSSYVNKIEAEEAAEREAAQAAREAAQKEAEEQRTAAAQTTSRSGSSSNSNTSTSSTDLPAVLQLIRNNESGGNYSAYNPTGCADPDTGVVYSCGGAYQLSEEYAVVWAARSGYSMNSQAQTWPANVQDAVALDLFYATNPDGDMWCHWTDYC